MVARTNYENVPWHSSGQLVADNHMQKKKKKKQRSALPRVSPASTITTGSSNAVADFLRQELHQLTVELHQVLSTFSKLISNMQHNGSNKPSDIKFEERVPTPRQTQASMVSDFGRIEQVAAETVTVQPYQLLAERYIVAEITMAKLKSTLDNQAATEIQRRDAQNQQFSS